MKNGWFCPKCDKVTEHKENKCTRCGCRLGQNKVIRKQRKCLFKKTRKINIDSWNALQGAEFCRSILEQFKEQGE